MSKDITIDVYFRVYCNNCGETLNASYDDCNRRLEITPCKVCLEQAKEEERERINNERN